MMLKSTTTLLLLFVLVSTSLAYIIPNNQRAGTYIESVGAMCLRTRGISRTAKEIAACNMYEAVAGWDNANKIDEFMLPLRKD